MGNGKETGDKILDKVGIEGGVRVNLNSPRLGSSQELNELDINFLLRHSMDT